MLDSVTAFIGRWRELRLRSFAHDYAAHPEVIDVEGGDGAVRDRGRGVKVDLDIVHLQVAARSHLAVSSSLGDPGHYSIYKPQGTSIQHEHRSKQLWGPPTSWLKH